MGIVASHVVALFIIVDKEPDSFLVVSNAFDPKRIATAATITLSNDVSKYRPIAVRASGVKLDALQLVDVLTQIAAEVVQAPPAVDVGERPRGDRKKN